MKKGYSIFIILFYFICFFNVYNIYANVFSFNEIIDQVDKNDKIVPDILKQKYPHIPNTSFKKKLCSAKYYNCYFNNTYKYFVKYNNLFDKQGSFYFGLIYNHDVKLLLASLAWCESAFLPNKVSGDQGYGLFQVTPSAANISVRQNRELLDPEQNIRYGLYILSNMYKNSYIYYPKEYDKSYASDFRWWLTLRGYNGGYLYIQKIISETNINAPSELISCWFNGDYIKMSEKTKRFLCYEKVNTIYPIKVYITYDYLRKNLK